MIGVRRRGVDAAVVLDGDGDDRVVGNAPATSVSTVRVAGGLEQPGWKPASPSAITQIS